MLTKSSFMYLNLCPKISYADYNIFAMITFSMTDRTLKMTFFKIIDHPAIKM